MFYQIAIYAIIFVSVLTAPTLSSKKQSGSVGLRADQSSPGAIASTTNPLKSNKPHSQPIQATQSIQATQLEQQGLIPINNDDGNSSVGSSNRNNNQRNQTTAYPLLGLREMIKILKNIQS